MTNDHVIIAPLVTEKSTLVTEKANQVVFKVRPEASKDKIRLAVEELLRLRCWRSGPAITWARCAGAAAR